MDRSAKPDFKKGLQPAALIPKPQPQKPNSQSQVNEDGKSKSSNSKK